jgi:hypothetical protein
VVGLAGRFDGNVLIQGDLRVTGRKFVVAAFADGSRRGLHCVESPESWFEDLGSGRLIDGVAHVAIDPDFAEVTALDHYHVFVQEYDGDHGLYVTNRTKHGFDVRARVTSASSSFSYRIVAKRKEFAAERFPRVSLPEARPSPNAAELDRDA